MIVTVKREAWSDKPTITPSNVLYLFLWVFEFHSHALCFEFKTHKFTLIVFVKMSFSCAELFPGKKQNKKTLLPLCSTCLAPNRRLALLGTSW